MTFNTSSRRFAPKKIADVITVFLHVELQAKVGIFLV